MASNATCAVCGVELDSQRPAIVAAHDGQTYQFCSAFCRDAFVAHPDRFAGAGR